MLGEDTAEYQLLSTGVGRELNYCVVGFDNYSKLDSVDTAIDRYTFYQLAVSLIYDADLKKTVQNNVNITESAYNRAIERQEREKKEATRRAKEEKEKAERIAQLKAQQEREILAAKKKRERVWDLWLNHDYTPIEMSAHDKKTIECQIVIHKLTKYDWI